MDSILTQILLFSITFIAGALLLFVDIKKDSYLKILLSFSGAFLFGLTILHFLPDLSHNYKPSYGVFILIGFSFQIVLEFLTQGIDHGHFHSGNASKIGTSTLIGLFLHALFEATPLSQGNINVHAHEHFHNYFFTGLILHKLPVAIVFGSMLNHYFGRKVKSFIILGLFALMAPIGLFLSEEIVFIQEYQDYFMAIVIGMFLYISTTILFETSKNHSFNLIKLISIIFGFGIAGAISHL